MNAHGSRTAQRPPLTVRVEGGYLRWTVWERIQHWLLASTFILLAITGFALRYPTAWWMKPFAGYAAVFALRGWLHRVSAVLFLGLSVIHLVWLVATPRGRAHLVALAPGLGDLVAAIRTVGHNLGFRIAPARFERYSYAEKAEYWALVWGGIVMGVTGVALWAKDATLAHSPRWVIDLLTVIHLYEAWLATLAIIVWHFYFVMFNPDIYPLQSSMVTGKLDEETMKDEHGAEWERIESGAVTTSDAKPAAGAA